ncbi:hypothetical protein AJ78_05722 [Emergomyces pasteurianus Ep9510]|uniref:Uncharacterized protein n=1 Tax=Emergomyces pasteurianus Ep9510 TaxID=1447872 RepID=A0A1J9Q121_9EURO|nr:hypothetical protein AJ78_05722 [Emergomyces pasteurianus Ep9510]
MPRTLPWQSDEKSRKSVTPATSCSKKQSKSTFSTVAESCNVPMPTRTPRQLVRTPSTSPPCEAPPVEFMKEGLENDDQYIMVEDEFLATAQTFTRHLHHAEYVRKKKEAKMKNANTIEDIARVGAKSTLSAEHRKKLESEENSTRQKAALDELKRVAGRPPVDSEVEDQGIESDEDKDDDPWVGTSLQNLMTNQTKHQSLVGLHRIKSTTRAAFGFAKTPVGLPRGSARSKQDEHPDEHPTSTRGADIDPHIVDDETTTEDDDDLDAQPRHSKSVKTSTPKTRSMASRSKTYTTVSRSTNTKGQTVAGSDPQEKAIVFRELGDSKSKRHPIFAPQERTSRIMGFFDDSDDEQTTKIKKREDNNNKHQIRKRLPSTTASNKRLENDRKSKKSRLNEVPTFLL